MHLFPCMSLFLFAHLQDGPDVGLELITYDSLSLKASLIDNYDFDRFFLHFIHFFRSKFFFAINYYGGIKYIVMNTGHIFMEA